MPLEPLFLVTCLGFCYLAKTPVVPVSAETMLLLSEDFIITSKFASICDTHFDGSVKLFGSSHLLATRDLLRVQRLKTSYMVVVYFLLGL